MYPNFRRTALAGWWVAQVALADAPQVVPGVDAGFVAVVPFELQCVLADGRHFDRTGRLLIHRQQGLGFRLWLARCAAGLLALFMAGGAGAGVAQPTESPRALVAGAPVNLHAAAFTLLDTDFQR